MNKMKYIIISLLAFGIITASCDDYLDKIPDNRTELNSPSAIGEILVNAYPNASFADFCEPMTDNAGDKGPDAYMKDQSNTEAYKWTEEFSSVYQGTPAYYWKACYKAIAHANEALAGIESLKGGEEYKSYKGEALICRAYSHFMLVNLFGKHYNKATAATDLGVPYVMESEKVVLKKYKRNTVKEVYDLIEKDLKEGLPLIENTRYSVPKYHFTRTAAYAFASRFYLFRADDSIDENGKNDFDRVIDYADKSLGTNPVDKLRDWNGFYATASYNAKNAQFTKASDNANLLLANAISDWAYGYPYLRYHVTYPIKNDILRPLFNNGAWSYVFNGNEKVLHIAKYKTHEIKSSPSAKTFVPSYMVPLFTGDEVLLNQIEAYVLKADFASAYLKMNVYISTRIKGYSSTNHQINFDVVKEYVGEGGEQDMLKKFVLELRRKEFIEDGMRWFDIRRYNLPIKHSFKGSDDVIELTELQRTMQIPSDAISNGLLPNKR